MNILKYSEKKEFCLKKTIQIIKDWSVISGTYVSQASLNL